MNQNESGNKPNDARTESTSTSGAIDKRTKQKEDTADSDNETDTEAGKPSKPSKIWTWMESKFPDAHAHDLLTLVFSAAIAVSTVIYAGVSVRTLIEINSGSKDTHGLAEATKTLAIAAKAQAEPVVKLRNQINLYRVVESQDILVYWGFQNDGKTIARYRYAIKLDTRNVIPTKSEYEFAKSDFGPTQPESLPTYSSELDVRYLKGTTNHIGGGNLYVWGMINSMTLWGEDKPIPFCASVPIKQVLDTKPGTGDVAGYHGSYENCLQQK
jgi:hypothetical protein